MAIYLGDGALDVLRNIGLRVWVDIVKYLETRSITMAPIG